MSLELTVPKLMRELSHTQDSNGPIFTGMTPWDDRHPDEYVPGPDRAAADAHSPTNIWQTWRILTLGVLNFGLCISKKEKSKNDHFFHFAWLLANQHKYTFHLLESLKSLKTLDTL